MASKANNKLDLEDKSSPYLQSLISEVRRFMSTNSDIKLKACIEIGHIVHLGDETVIIYLSQNNQLLQELINLLNDDNPSLFSLQLAAMQTMSIIVRSSTATRNVLLNLGILPAFKKGLQHPLEEIRVYACHSLFFFIAKSPEKFGFFFQDVEIKEGLRKAAMNDWSLFLYNDAEELLKMYDISYDPYLVSGCISSRNKGTFIQHQSIKENELEANY